VLFTRTALPHICTNGNFHTSFVEALFEFCLVHLAFGQVGWTDGLSGIEWIFQRDNFGPDVTTAALGLLESVVGDKSGHHVGMRRNQDTEGFARDLRSGVYEGDSFSFGPEGPQLRFDARQGSFGPRL
jgi:hypothetical protein